MNIGESIKYWRKQKNMTQKQLAELADISEISIRKYETNERKPKIDTLSRIADSLGVVIGDLDENYSYMIQDKREAQYVLQQLEEFSANILTSDIPNEIKKENTLKIKELVEKLHSLINLIDNAISADQTTKKLTEERDKLLEDVETAEFELYGMCLAVMSELNYDGQEKVINYAIDLLKIPEYQRKYIEETATILNAAHERTDIETTEEMKKHDDDIMNDENF